MEIYPRLLEDLVGSVMSEAEGSIPQCHYVFGEQGSGKTTLLRSVYKRLNQDGRFYVDYINCLYNPDLKLEDLMEIHPGARTVLLLDDFDSFLAASTEVILYTIREMIYSGNGAVIIATGKALNSQFTSYTAPLYDSFLLHSLNEMDVETARNLMIEMREQDDVPNPDLLNEVFSIIGCTLDSCALLASVRRFNTDVTELLAAVLSLREPYYKSIIEGLTLSQRKIIIAILSFQQPMLLKDIRLKTGMSSQEIMPVLVLLAKKGLIDSIRSGARKTQYTIRDKRFGAWYRYCVAAVE